MKQLHRKQTAVLSRLFAVGAVLGPALSEGLSAQGLTTARAEVIWRLHNDGSMNQKQLSEALRCTPRNVTGLVDALEGANLVERTQHPTDRRAILVSLTPHGEGAAKSWDRENQLLATRLLGGMDSGELEALQGLLDRVLEHLGAPMS